MLKLMVRIAFAGLIVAAVVISRPAVSQAAGDNGGDKVTICHFDGHDGDFVTNNWITLGNPVCDNEGGNAIVVASAACEFGHSATTRYRKDCYQGSEQEGAPQ